ncbi:hypothetical protein ACFP4H_12125 [Pseudophaeobacter arcticus]|uniref:hypothetical protein n=1 Tax=Pseudophaeobacter arcticus TaxID=385492 RepID=UPI00041C8834|nr:hypothetical protein [Pseudophaeobacter arcticus]
MKILVTGDSHIGALNRGLQQLLAARKTDRSVDISILPLGGGHLLPTPFFRDAGDHAEMVAPDYQRHMSRLPPASPKFDAVVLSMPLWPMRVQHQITWGKFALAEHLEGRKTISHLVFKTLVLQDQKYVLELIDLLGRIGIPVAAVSPPRMFRDHSTLKFLPATQARTCFDTYLEIMKAELKARSVPVIDLPRDCCDAEGFMLQKFRHEDPEDEHHANAEFGALMVSAVERWAVSDLAAGWRKKLLPWRGSAS